MDFDADAFEERAAIMEYDGGLSRFKAETLAAQAQGKSRWEAIGDVAKRVVAESRDRRAALDGKERPDNLSGVQPAPEEKTRPVPQRDRGR